MTDRLLDGLAIELVCRARQQGPAEIHVRLNGPRCVAITLDILEMDSPKRDHVVERIHISRLFGNVHQRRAKIGFDTAAQSDRKRRRVLKDFSQRIRQDLYLFGPEGLRIGQRRLQFPRKEVSGHAWHLPLKVDHLSGHWQREQLRFRGCQATTAA